VTSSIEPAIPKPALHRGSDEMIHVADPCHVGDDRHRLTTGGANFVGHRVELVRPSCTDHQRVAILRQPQRRCATDARGCAGDRDNAHEAF